MTEFLMANMHNLDDFIRGCPHILQLVAHWDDKEIVQRFISHSKGSMHCLEEVGGSPLLIAAKKWNIEAILAFLEGGADINATDRDGNTFLHHGVLQSNPEIVKLAFEKYAPFLLTNNEGLNPLHLAVRENHEEVQNICFSEFESATSHPGLLEELLLMAVKSGNYAITKLLIMVHGLSPNCDLRKAQSDIQSASEEKFPNESR